LSALVYYLPYSYYLALYYLGPPTVSRRLLCIGPADVGGPADIDSSLTRLTSFQLARLRFFRALISLSMMSYRLESDVLSFAPRRPGPVRDLVALLDAAPSHDECFENSMRRVFARPLAAPAPAAPPAPLLRRIWNVAVAAVSDYQCMPNVVCYGAVVLVAGAILVNSRSPSGNARRELAPWNAAILTLILSSVVRSGLLTFPLVSAFWLLSTVVFHDIATVSAGISQIDRTVIGGIGGVIVGLGTDAVKGLVGLGKDAVEGLVGLGKDAVEGLDKHATDIAVALSGTFFNISKTGSNVVSALWKHSSPSNILQIVFAAVIVAYAPSVGHALQQFF
jgi:hypothetical protein